MEVAPGDLITLEVASEARYGNFERLPRKNEIYVVCDDMSIQSTHEPGRVIRWKLVIEDDVAYVFNPHRHEVRLFHVGELPRCMVPTASQLGTITEFDDEGDEVDSFEILPFDPTPMDIARSLGNSEQAEAINKFLEGKISYAEMRMICG